MEDEHKGYFFMLLLVFQSGLQPIFLRDFLSGESFKAVFIIVSEMLKVVLSIVFLVYTRELAVVRASWTLRDSLKQAAFPSAVYAVQGMLLQVSTHCLLRTDAVQIAVQNMSALAFNILNQTKMIWSAVFLFLMLGKRQSLQQVGSLAMLTVAAVLLTTHHGSGAAVEDSLFYGVVPICLASITSGFATVLTQKPLQSGRNTYLFSAELGCYTSFILFVGIVLSPERISIVLDPLRGWTAPTFLPALLSAAGGIVIGFVTKYAGGVRKGFAIVGGILLTAMIDVQRGRIEMEWRIWLALPLVFFSTLIHSMYPHRPPRIAENKLV
jgi:UDP-sugar transporter A1/2/3